MNFLKEIAPLSHLSLLFHTQNHPSGNAPATTCCMAKNRCSRTAFSLLPSLTLRLYFFFQALETDFPEDLKNPQRQRSNSVHKRRQLLHSHD